MLPSDEALQAESGAPFRLADMDMETRHVVYLAHIVAKYPHKMDKLVEALAAFDKKHEAERTNNLLTALFAEEETDVAEDF